MSEEQDKGEIKDTHPNPFRFLWRVDPKRPIYSALLEAELHRLDKVFDGSLIKRMNNIRDEDDAKAFLKECRILIKEGEEILAWLFPQQPSSFESALTFVMALQSRNISQDIWKSLLERAGKRSRGRPISKRQIAIKALEMKMSDPKKWSNMKLAQKFCDCGKSKHDAGCNERLRHNIINLKKVIKKYCPDLPCK